MVIYKMQNANVSVPVSKPNNSQTRDVRLIKPRVTIHAQTKKKTPKRKKWLCFSCSIPYLPW